MNKDSNTSEPLLLHKEIKGDGAMQTALRHSRDYLAISKWVCEMYQDNPYETLWAVGKKNLIRCHKYYLDLHYSLLISKE